MTKTINFDHGYQCHGCCKESTGDSEGLIARKKG
jgi:hypothetical protein